MNVTMKRFNFLLLSVTLIVSSAWADRKDVVTDDISKLPPAARTFIQKYFPNIPVSYLKIEKEFFSKTYDVILTNGYDLEFDEDGAWIEIDCNKDSVPADIIPQKIYQYYKNKFAQYKIIKVEKEKKEYQIKLSSGLELIFNLKQEFLRFDD